DQLRINFDGLRCVPDRTVHIRYGEAGRSAIQPSFCQSRIELERQVEIFEGGVMLLPEISNQPAIVVSMSRSGIGRDRQVEVRVSFLKLSFAQPQSPSINVRVRRR